MYDWAILGGLHCTTGRFGAIRVVRWGHFGGMLLYDPVRRRGDGAHVEAGSHQGELRGAPWFSFFLRVERRQGRYDGACHFEDYLIGILDRYLIASGSADSASLKPPVGRPICSSSPDPRTGLWRAARTLSMRCWPEDCVDQPASALLRKTGARHQPAKEYGAKQRKCREFWIDMGWEISAGHATGD